MKHGPLSSIFTALLHSPFAVNKSKKHQSPWHRANGSAGLAKAPPLQIRAQRKSCSGGAVLAINGPFRARDNDIEGRAAPNENSPPLPKITATVVHHNRRVTSKCCTGQSSAPLNSGHSDLLGSILAVINTPTRDKRSLYITMHLTCGIGGSTEHSCNKSVRVDIYHRVAVRDHCSPQRPLRALLQTHADIHRPGIKPFRFSGSACLQLGDNAHILGSVSYEYEPIKVAEKSLQGSLHTLCRDNTTRQDPIRVALGFG
ncbi:hypothetical protein Bbelb_122990 [Branchiostoma belcheri]|nr:hypothetical protein Bbelb_122990 [Branchiostoma belcheri]